MNLGAWINCAVAASEDDPSSIADLLFWFNPSGISGSNGADMTTWTDDGPNGFVPAAVGGSRSRPTVATGSLNGATTAADAGHPGLQIPDSPGVSLSSKDSWTLFTVAKVTAVNSDFLSLASSGSQGFRLGLNPNRNLQLVYSNVGNVTGEPALDLNTWYSIVIVVDSSVMNVYINGSLAYAFGTHTMASTTFPTKFDLCQSVAANLIGNLAETALYDRALNSTEIATLAAYSNATYLIGQSTAAPMACSIPAYVWFNPAGLTGSNGSDITSWVDSGLWGITATAGGGAGSRPTVAASSLNGFPTAACANVAGLTAPAVGSGNPAGMFLDNYSTWSIFAIVKFSGLGSSENDFCSIGGGSGDGARFGLDSAGKFLITIPNVGNFTDSGLSPSTGTWHKVIITSNAGALNVYVDNTTAVSFGTHTVAGTPSQLNICMGYNSGGYLFQGNLAELAGYNGVLSTTDISNLMSYASSVYGV